MKNKVNLFMAILAILTPAYLTYSCLKVASRGVTPMFVLAFVFILFTVVGIIELIKMLKR